MTVRRERVDREVIRFDGEASEWNRFVQEQEEWTHFHLHGWLNVVEEVFGHSTLAFCSRGRNGEIDGVLPLVRVQSPLFGDYLVSMPFVNYGGPLGTAPAVHALTEAAVDVADDLGVDLLQFRSWKSHGLELPTWRQKVTSLLDLPPGDVDQLWDDIPGSRRRQIRQAREEGTAVDFGADRLSGFYQVFSRHMRDLGTPVLPLSFFETVLDHFGSDAWIATATLDGRTVAGAFGLHWDDQVEMTWVSDLPEHRDRYPNMLLYWSFMARATEEELSVFNFGRSTRGSGPHRFKQQWGASDHDLWWYYHGDGERLSTPAPDEGSFTWAPAIWQRLPRFVTDRLGPQIIKYIP